MSATILAATSWNLPVTFSARLPQMPVNLSPTLLVLAFSTAVFTARGSMSTPTADLAPSSRAATARMPLPQPMSRKSQPGTRYFSSSSRHRRVVSWVPVPKARPGSRSSTTRPWGSQASSHRGRMSSFSPTGMGWKYFFQLLIQSSFTQLSRVMVWSMPRALYRSSR